ncbi:helicase associated domain-containing protein, partial [bacterium]|nr:helicase associated domain-containing protein [bacterium]
FIWDIPSYQWDNGFKALQCFHGREGHCLVPDKHHEQEFYLGSWVKVQRRGRQSLEQRQKLDEIGFIWSVLDWQWDTGYQNLLKFVKRERHCQVSAKHEEDGFKLGVWVGTQRSKFDVMSPERKQRLDDIGFIWDASKDKT